MKRLVLGRLRRSSKKINEKWKIVQLMAMVALSSALAGCVGTTTTGSDPWEHDFSGDCSGLSTFIDDRNDVHLVWMERVEEYGDGFLKAFYMKVTDRGDKIIDRMELGEMTGFNWTTDQLQCDLVVDSSGTAHAVFGLQGSIYFVSINKVGVGSYPKIISSTTGMALDPDISIAENDAIHIVWTDFRFGLARIAYHRVSATGDVLYPIEVIGPSGSYNPSICVDKDGYIYIAYYREYTESSWFFFFSSTSDHYRNIVLEKMDNDMKIRSELYLDIEEYQWYELDTLEMILRDDGSPVLYWTTYNSLQYYTISKQFSTGSHEDSRQFAKIDDTTFFLHVEEPFNLCNYTISARVYQTTNMPQKGDILIKVNNSDYRKIGEYSFSREFFLVYFFFGGEWESFQADITDMISGNCDLLLHLKDASYYGSARFGSAELITSPGMRDGPSTHPILLNTDPIAKPSASPGKDGVVNFLSISKVEDGSVSYHKTRYGSETPVMENSFKKEESEVLEVSLSSDTNGYDHIYWIYQTEDENKIAHARLDRDGNLLDGPKTITTSPRRWHWYDDLGGPIATAFIFIGALLVIVLSIVLLVRRYRRKWIPPMTATAILDMTPVVKTNVEIQDEEEMVIFEVIKRD